MAIASSSSTHPLRPLLWVLALLGLGELVLLRFMGALSFDRAIAGGDAPGGIVSTLGSFCLDLATVFGFVCLLVFALTPLRWRSGWSFTIVGYVVLGALLPWAASLGPWVPATFGAFSCAAMLVAGLVAISRPQAEGRFAIALLLLAFVCSYVYALSPMVLGSDSTISPGGPGTLGFGEAVYLIAGLFAFRTWGWPRVFRYRSALYAGVAAAVALSLYLGIGGSSAAAALTVSTGLTLFLPLWIYVVSTFCFATTAAACLLDRDGFATGAAFIVLLIVGLLPSSSYQQALLLLGMVLLAHGETVFQKGSADADLASER